MVMDSAAPESSSSSSSAATGMGSVTAVTPLDATPAPETTAPPIGLSSSSALESTTDGSLVLAGFTSSALESTAYVPLLGAPSSSALEATSFTALSLGSSSSSSSALVSTALVPSSGTAPVSSTAPVTAPTPSSALDSSSATPPTSASASATAPSTSSSASAASTDLEPFRAPATGEPGNMPNALLLPEIPPGSAFGDVLDPYARIFPWAVSFPVGPSLQAKLPDTSMTMSTNSSHIMVVLHAKKYQDSEIGPSRQATDEDVALGTGLNEVTQHVVQTLFEDELEYKKHYPRLDLGNKAAPCFSEVKISKRGGHVLGPKPGKETILRVGINGFGRIGRLVARLVLQNKNMELIAVNDPLVSANDMTKALEDTSLGVFPVIKVLAVADPGKIPWADSGVDYVVESTGHFTDTVTASAHLKGGAKKVVICALSKEAPSFVFGVNEDNYRPHIDIISIADCATICLALLAKILHTRFGIKRCHGTIKGSYSSAAEIKKALGFIIPDLVGNFDVTVRLVPHAKLSCAEMTVELDRCDDYAMIKNSVREECATELENVLANLQGGVGLKVTDYLGDHRSCFFDADAGVKLGDGSFKLFAWFNHERSYGQRCTDMILHVAKVASAEELLE